jgi:hypothetical protein
VLDKFSILERKQVNVCDIFKFIVSVRGGHCDYPPVAPNILATPLHKMDNTDKRTK